MRKAAAGLSCALWLALQGCGTPGVPLPPSLNLPQPVADLAVARSGQQLTAKFTVPTENTDSLTLKHMGKAVLEECDDLKATSCAPLHEWKTGAATPGARMEWTGDLPRRPYLTLKLFNDRGKSADHGNVVWVPLSSAYPNLTGATAEVSKDAVILHLESGPGATADTTAVLRVTRVDEDQRRAATLGEAGAGSTEFRDTDFEWAKHYRYEIHTVNRALSPEGVAVEFESGAPVGVEVVTKDVFPPAPPTGLAAVYTGFEPSKPAIDLSWDPSFERDVVGYNVYRDGAKVNRELVKLPTYHDQAVVAGQAYHYQVTAVDSRGNESGRSAAASEQVPRLP